MKYFKILIAAAAILITTNSFAQYFALPMTLGVQGGIGSKAYVYEYENDTYEGEVTQGTAFYNIGLFFDAKYFRTSLVYAANSGNTTYEDDYDIKAGGSDSISKDFDFKFEFAEFTGLFKYPFSTCTNVELWPALGVAYSKCLTAEDEDGNSLGRSDYDDFWIVLGLGMDFKLTQTVIATTDMELGLCLTPGIYEESGTDISNESGAKFNINIGIGYRFGEGI